MYFNAFPLFFGLMTGSFLNMLIYRLPRETKLLSPARSFCPNCKKKITLFENIPLLSFLFLKGRCSGCNGKISWLYPTVESLCAVISLVLFPAFISPDSLMEYFFKYTIFASFLVHFIIDFKHKILPDIINLYLAIIFLFHSILYHSWEYWAMGALLGYAFPLLVTWIFYKLRGIKGMGMGDIKLFAALGIYLGVHGIVYNIFLSCFMGSIVGIILLLMKKMKKEDAIPFGPYIIIVAVFQIFFEREFNQLIKFIFS